MIKREIELDIGLDRYVLLKDKGNFRISLIWKTYFHSTPLFDYWVPNIKIPESGLYCLMSSPIEVNHTLLRSCFIPVCCFGYTHTSDDF